MSAGTAYSKRYDGGFIDLPTKTTPIDQQFLDAVEAALLQLIGAAPSADGQVMQWDDANTRYGPALILNKNVGAGAAIAKSKLDFTGANGIVNADVAAAAAIARSKLNFGAGLVDADVAAAAAIAYSKLLLTGNIVNADISAAAAIAASKIAGYPTDAKKVLLGDGTWGVGNLVRCLAADGSQIVVVNTAVQTSLLHDATIPMTIPAGLLSSHSYARLKFAGEYQNSTGAAREIPQFIVTQFGVATVLNTGAIGGGVGANSVGGAWGYEGELLISNRASTAAQIWSLRIWGSSGGAGADSVSSFPTGTGRAELRNGGMWEAVGLASTAINTLTTDIQIGLYCINQIADPNLQTYCEFRSLEVCHGSS